MDRKHFLLVIILAAVSGLVGGVVGSWFIVDDSAFAQKEHQQQIITADEFHLLDKDGKIRAKLALYPDGSPRLVFFDKSSKPRVFLGVSPGQDKESLDKLEILDEHRKLFGESPVLSFVDSNDKTRASIALRGDGSPHLTFYGKEGLFKPFSTRLELELDPNEGPALELWDDFKVPENMTEEQRMKAGKKVITPRAFFGLSVDGEPKMTLSDKDGNIGIGLFVPTDGYRGLQVADKDDKRRVELAVLKDDTPVINFFGKNDKQLLALGLDRDEVPTIQFIDKQNIIRAGLTLEADGSPFLRLHDENGNIRLSLGSASLIGTRTGSNVKRPASSLVLLDKDEKVIWSAP